MLFTESELEWVYPEVNETWISKISKEFCLDYVTSRILANKGFSTLKQVNRFLYSMLPNLHNPSSLSDMDAAISRLKDAVHKKENILIFGDNDVDGMTGTVILIDFFRYLGLKVFYCFPDRNLQNEKLLNGAIQNAIDNDCRLLITVDCGITAAAAIDEVVKRNIDVIVTDHHEPTGRIPNCIATLNPKLTEDPYPNKDLTGVGVTFKLIHAFTSDLVKSKSALAEGIDLKNYLDLVALGTIADMGALVGENRILVRYGLDALKETKRVGLQKLLSICELAPSEITPTTLALKIAPRLNSLGRIDNPKKGVELLLMSNEEKAEDLAKDLEANNSERQRIEKEMTDNIQDILDKNPSILEERAIVLSSDKWHAGVIPILTSKLSKQFNRPCLIIAVESGIGKGSLRTIQEFPLISPLKRLSSLLVNFGGHDFAAGLTIKEENIQQFKERFLKECTKKLKETDLHQKLQLDSQADFSDLTFDFLESLALLEPYGTKNSPPVLYTEVKQAWLPKIVGGSHLKLYLQQGERILEGIAFGMAHRKEELKGKNLKLTIAYTPQINTFQNKSSIQLLIKDFKRS
ncbi:MAG: single-stranded-DNA-specific exonuclease RecJ [Chlamydiales bacterium]|nr:single-stranded-DNA-specific exonuclease RecJ [Chlamydiales bacterium]